MTSGKQSKKLRKAIASSPTAAPGATVLDAYPIPSSQQTELEFIHQRYFSGPIPPADELAQYKLVDPTLPAQIVAMAKSEQEHRQSNESKMVDNAIRVSRTTPWLYTTLGLAMIAASVPIAIWGTAGGGTMTALAPVITYIASRMWAAKSKKEKVGDENDTHSNGKKGT